MLRRFVLESPCIASAFCMVSSVVDAGEARGMTRQADRQQYSLFHPTPTELMRPMETDRPDRTESPYTVDAGHFQIELDFVGWTHDRSRSTGEDISSEGWSVAPLNMKIGLLNNVDFQLVFDSYGWVRTRDSFTGAVQKRSGFGDVTARVKINLWGNDGGRTAVAMMPFVTFPTNQDGLGGDALEGGVIFPFAADLPGGWGLGMQTEVDVLQNESGHGFHAAFANSITLNRDIVGKLAGYVEFFSEVSTQRDTPWVGTFDAGLLYALSANVQIDAGVNIGVTKSAPDWNPFLGLSWRF